MLLLVLKEPLRVLLFYSTIGAKAAAPAMHQLKRSADNQRGQGILKDLRI
jgi:hypothetical protein